ncbi:MAG: hypothetical protein GX066_00570 [Clostridiaceae bacterium]|nr:hypothetical protein [Clostridiaceae bacterium]
MNIRDVSIGTKLELTLYDIRGKEKETTYVSQLEEILNSEQILIAAPIYQGRFIYVPRGSRLKVVFPHEVGLFSFYGEIDGYRKKGNVIVYKLRITTEITKIQRREYYRFNCVVPVKIRVVSSADDNDDNNREDSRSFVNELARDISGGGIGFFSNRVYNMDEVLELEVDIEGNIIKTLGKVVRCRLLNDEKNLYDVGIVYKDINERDRDVIIKFIFDKQVKLIQKGML